MIQPEENCEIVKGKWYPRNPNTESDSTGDQNYSIITADDTPPLLPEPHQIWSDGQLKYTTSNKWQSIPNEKRELRQRHRLHGVEVRTLPSNHFLSGECGLFAIKKFTKFDILGEYTGKIVDSDVCGHYVATLEDRNDNKSLGIDAQTTGNELRFINSYLNVAFKPNCTMRTAYINTYPHIILVCMEDIEIGDEFLLDYGEGYNSAFLQPKVDETPSIPTDIFRRALPGYGSDSSSNSDGEDA